MSKNRVNLDHKGLLWRFCTLVLVAFFLGTWGEKVTAQETITINGGTMFNRITFEQPDAPGFLDPTHAYNEFEVAAILRVVNYLNDVVDIPMQPFHGGNAKTLHFRRDPPDLTGTATGGPGGTITYNREWTHTSDRQSSQLAMNFWENVLLHESGHVLGMLFVSLGIDLADGSTGTSGSYTITSLGTGTWERWFTDSNGNALGVGNTYIYDLNNPNLSNLILWNAPLGSAVNGDVWAGGTARGIAIHPEIGGTAHPYDPPGAVISYRGYQDRDFFTEIELSYLVDMGFTIQLDRFFGRSLNRVHSNTIHNDTAFYGDGVFGVGLHIVTSDDQNIRGTPHMAGNTLDPNAVGNTVVQQANLVARGANGVGIRIEGYNHTITIDQGVIVAATGGYFVGANGEFLDTATGMYYDSTTGIPNAGGAARGQGIGVLATMGGGATLNNYGTIYAAWLDWDASGNPVAVLDGNGRHILNEAIYAHRRFAEVNLLAGSRVVGNLRLNGDTATFQSDATLSPYAGIDTGIGVFTPQDTFATLTVAGALTMLDNSILQVGLGNVLDPENTGYTISDTVSVTGTANIGAITIDLVNLHSGAYTYLLLSADGGLTYTDNAATLSYDTARYLSSTFTTEAIGNDLILRADVRMESIILYWTGRMDNGRSWSAQNWEIDTERGVDRYFGAGDTVIFDRTAAADRWVVDVSPEGVVVSQMTVENLPASPYVFNLTVKAGNYYAIHASNNFAIGNGDIDLGNAILNIAGYDPGAEDSYFVAYNIWNVIKADGTLTGFNPLVTVAGQASVDFLTASAFQDGNEIKVATMLSWYSTDPNRAAHGRFTIANGETFTLGAILKDTAENMEIGWNGDSLTKLGGGTLILTADNEYTGMTTVMAGTLQLGDGGSDGWVDGDIVNNSIVVFDHNQLKTFSNIMTGTGSLVKKGANTLILTGDNIYAGGTQVEGGSLQIGSNDGTTGSISTDGAITIGSGAKVVFNRHADVTISGIISGDGDLTQFGFGTLTLTGNNTYTGTTTVHQGSALFVNGNSSAATGAIHVLPGAMFGGNGAVGGAVTLNRNATLSPGGENAVGTLTVGNGITFEDNSIYRYEIDRLNGVSDSLVVNGDVEIVGGAKLDVNFTTEGKVNLGDEFRVIRADFRQFIDDTTFGLDGLWSWRFGDEIRSDGYYLTWLGFGESIRPFGATPNAVHAAKGMDRIGTDKLDGRIGTLYDTLDNLHSPASMAHAFAQLHGEVFASNKEAVAELQRNFQQLLPNGREYYSQAALPKKWNRWGTLTGGWENRKRIGQYSSYDLTSTGVAVGVDRVITNKILFGAAFGYDHANQKFDSINSKDQIDAFRTMLYGSWFDGNHFVDAYGGYTKNSHRTKRNISVLNTTAKSRYDDDMGSVGLDAGRVWKFGDTLLTPSIGVHYIRLYTPDVTEKQGADANLFVRGDYYESFRMPITAKVSRVFAARNGIVLTPEARASYIREFANDTARVVTSFDRVRDVSFVAESGKWGRHSGRLGVGLGAVRNQFSLRVDYDFTVYNHTSLSEFGATFGMLW